MKKLFLCLANSKKYGERCVAGVELTRDRNGKYDIVKHPDGSAKWLRPVTRTVHGQVPAAAVEDMRILDVFELHDCRPCPAGYQSENHFFNPNTMCKVHRINLKVRNFKYLVEQQICPLFGTAGNRLTEREMCGVGRSLALVKGERTHIYESKARRFRLRVGFDYAGCRYDLPVTDVNFFDRYWEDATFVREANDFFITVSLGVPFEGNYYKLAAGVICI